MSSFLQFSTHDVVVLKLNKADLGSPALGQGVVYRLKVTLIDSTCENARKKLPMLLATNGPSSEHQFDLLA